MTQKYTAVQWWGGGNILPQGNVEEPDLQESFCGLSTIFCNTSLQMRLTAVLSDSWEAGRWMMLEGRIAVSYC